jgi:hypothetical protein
LLNKVMILRIKKLLMEKDVIELTEEDIPVA